MDLNMFVNMGIVGGIIGVLQGVKALDKNNKLSKGMLLTFAMVGGFLCGFIVTPYDKTGSFIMWLQKVCGAGITYAGASSILFQTGKTLVNFLKPSAPVDPAVQPPADAKVDSNEITGK